MTKIKTYVKISKQGGGNIKKYDIYYCQLDGIGSVQQGVRPCLIVQNNMGNKHSPTTIIVPITNKEPKIPTHMYIDVGKVQGTLLFEQIRVIDKMRVMDKVGEVIDESVIKEIENKIRLSLDL